MKEWNLPNQNSYSHTVVFMQQCQTPYLLVLQVWAILMLPHIPESLSVNEKYNSDITN